MVDLRYQEVPVQGNSEPLTHRKHFKLLAAALSPGLAFMAVFMWRSSANRFGDRRFTLFDDAMISMTYARTLASTGELVWFPGAPRAEGFTNPLWTMYMAGLHFIGLEESTASMVVSISGAILILAAGTLVFVLVTKALHAEPRRHVFGAVAAGAVPLTYPLVFWTLRGMEVGLLAFLLLVCLWGAPISRPSSASSSGILLGGVAGALGVLTRFDFLVFVLALALCCAVWTTGWAQKARVLAIFAGPGMLAAVAVLCLQRVYYGDWLPTTYRLKLEGVALQIRVARGLYVSGKLAAMLVVLLAAMALVILKESGTCARRVAIAVMASVAVGIGYSIWVGGDAWEQGLLFNRYVSIVLPAAMVLVGVGAGVLYQHLGTPFKRWAACLVAVPIASVAAGLSSNPARFFRGLALVSVAASLLALGALIAAIRLQPRFRSASQAACAIGLSTVILAGATVSAYPTYLWVRLGAMSSDYNQQKTQEGYALARATESSAVIATLWAGAPAYYSRRAMIDLLGKNDETIARMAPVTSFEPGHNKWDYDYSVGLLLPDVVFQPWLFDSDRERFRDWGYIEGCLGLDDPSPSFFRTDSEAVRWEWIVTCE